MAAEGAGAGRRVGEENLDFSPEGVDQPRFSLAPEPPIAPQCVGFGLRSPGGKKGRTGAFRRPGGATRAFFWRRRRKSGLGGLLGVQLEML